MAEAQPQLTHSKSTLSRSGSKGSLSSPKSTRKVTDEEAILQVQQFVDEWHYNIVHSGLAARWSRTRTLWAMFEVFEITGTMEDKLTEQEKEKMAGMDENRMLHELIDRIPLENRNKLEALAIGLQHVMKSVADVRNALEGQNDDQVQQAFAPQDEEPVSTLVLQELLKNGVVEASKEMEKVLRCKNTWTKNTNARLDRLAKAAQYADMATSQLMAVEAQLANVGGDSKKKGKDMLMGVAAKNDKGLKHTVFAAWIQFHMRNKAQGAIRDKYAKQLKDAEDAIIQYCEKRVILVRNALMRKVGESDVGLLALCVETWREDIEERRKDGDKKESLLAMQKKLADQADAQKENTKKVMARMAAGHESTLVSGVFDGWKTFHKEYLKNKELEDQVKATEAALKAHMEKKKEEAKGVLDRMTNASGTGLLMTCVQGWANYIKEEKKDREMQDKLMESEGKFKALAMRQSGNASGVQTRVNDQMRQNLLMRVVGSWALETKAVKIEKYYVNKIESKRRQLNSVQQLFKSFSKQLEQGLANVDQDSSARSGYRDSRAEIRSHGKRSSKSSGHSALSSGRDSRSLPNIHARPAVA